MSQKLTDAALQPDAKFVLLTSGGNIWYIANDNNFTIEEHEVKLVGTIEVEPGKGGVELGALQGTNFW